MMLRILAINPGLTSTKVACFGDGALVMDVTVRHSLDALQRFETIGGQFSFPTNCFVNVWKSGVLMLGCRMLLWGAVGFSS